MVKSEGEKSEVAENENKSEATENKYEAAKSVRADTKSEVAENENKSEATENKYEAAKSVRSDTKSEATENKSRSTSRYLLRNRTDSQIQKIVDTEKEKEKEKQKERKKQEEEKRRAAHPKPPQLGVLEGNDFYFLEWLLENEEVESEESGGEDEDDDGDGDFVFTYQDEDWLPEVRDQGLASFCWSVGSTNFTAAVASFICEKKIPAFSPQFLIDWLPRYIGAEVKWVELEGPEIPQRLHYVQSTFLALKLIEKIGIPWDDSYPYLGHYDTDHAEDFFPAARVVDPFAIPKPDWSACYLRRVLKQHGCLLGTFRCNDHKLAMYKYPDIYSLSRRIAARQGLHCVPIVGCGRTKDKEFAVIQNSYGKEWGKKGFGYVDLNLFDHIQGVHGVDLNFNTGST